MRLQIMRLNTILLGTLFFSLVFPAYGVEFRKRLHQLEKQYSNADVKTEIEFGRRLAAVILSKFRLHPSEELQQYVNLIGRGVSAMAGRPEINYYFGVIDTEQINTIYCPGGYVFITIGAMKLMKNEAQLVGVIANEISHIEQRVMVQKMRIRGIAEAISAMGVDLSLGNEKKLKFYKWSEKSIALLFKDGRPNESVLEGDFDAIQIISRLGYDWPSYREYLQKVESHIKKTVNSEEIEEEVKSLMKIYSGTDLTFEDRLNKLDRNAEIEGIQDHQGITRQNRFKAYVEL